MSQSLTPLQNEILDLAAAVCLDRLTDSQSLRLQELLADNANAQTTYSQTMMLHAELFWIEDSISATPATSGVSLAGSPVSISLSNPDLASHAFEYADAFKVGAWIFSIAAVLLVALGLAAFPGGWFNSGPTVTQMPTPIPRGAEVAKVTGLLNCRWHAAAPHSDPIGFGSTLYAGQELDLVEGVAEITFDDGARMILQAPVKLDVAAAESTLYRGRLTATCPPGAEGFRVDTEGLTLIDLGTEFGVMADDEGNTEVHVFDGLVEGHYRESVDGPLRKVQWRTNETVRFDRDKNEISPLENSLTTFVRTLSSNLGPVSGLLAGEDFDYPIGRLGGQNGGFGWGGPWVDMSIEQGLPEDNAVEPGSLRIGILSSSGNHAALKGGFNRIRRVLSHSFSGVFDTAGFIEDQDGARVIGREGTTLYISFTQKVNRPDQVFYGFELHRGDGNRNRVLCIGHAAAKHWTDGDVRTPDKDAGVTGWAVTSELNGDENSLLELGDLGTETTDVTLFVLKIKFGPGNNDTIEVFKNPASLWDEQQCTPQVVGQGNFAFDRISLANFEGDKIYQVDHIRIGTSFSGVTRPRWQADEVQK